MIKRFYKNKVQRSYRSRKSWTEVNILEDLREISEQETRDHKETVNQRPTRTIRKTIRRTIRTMNNWTAYFMSIYYLLKVWR